MRLDPLLFCMEVSLFLLLLEQSASLTVLPCCCASVHSQGGTVGWERPYVYILLILSLIFLAAFFASQQFPLLRGLAFSSSSNKANKARPLLPTFLWKTPSFTAVMVSLSFGWMSFGIWLYYTTIL